ncbi:hypothetical protein ACLFMI_07145 [Pseudonocardia nantongensis]|uniref:hypothetical protein n=1 Tax=Pseudonocardia nantongensis TaxID=1181885 RepID=UPI00397A60B8
MSTRTVTVPADASPTGAPRSLRCRRVAAGTGHRAVAGELAALAFQPVDATAPAARVTPVPRSRAAAD